MTYHDDVLGNLAQLAPRETARLAGALAPTLEITHSWLKRMHHIAAGFWDTHRGVELPLLEEQANEIFSKVKQTTDILTPHQLWTIFTDLGAYSDNAIPSHFANTHTLDQVARYTLNDIGTRLVPKLLAYLHNRVILPHNIFDDLTAPDDGND